MFEQSTAKALINQMLITAQKSRSNVRETMNAYTTTDDAAEEILADLMPHLMASDPSNINIADALLRYSNKEELEPGDLYNALTIANMEPAFPVMHLLIWGEDLPRPISAFI